MPPFQYDTNTTPLPLADEARDARLLLRDACQARRSAQCIGADDARRQLPRHAAVFDFSHRRLLLAAPQETRLASSHFVFKMAR